MHRTPPYFRDLLPWLILSTLVHAAVALGTLVEWGTRTAADFAITQYQVPAGSEGAPPEVERERIKRYRLNYFPKVAMLLPDPPVVIPEPKPEPEPEPAPPTPTPAPVAPVKPTPAPVIPPTLPIPTGGSSEGAYRGPTGVETGALTDPTGAFLRMPPFELTMVRDTLIRTEADFAGHPTIYVLSDLSTETGLEDLFTWTRFYHDLMHIPGVVDPPWLVGVGTALQDEFFLTPDLAEESLKRRWETSELYPGPLWGDGAYDATRQLADGLALEELPVPQLYLVDWQGNVRVKIVGRLEELTPDQVTAVISEIKLLWGMNDVEFLAAKLVALQWHSKLQAGKLDPPLPAVEAIVPVPPPPGRLPNEVAPPPG